MIIRKPMKSLKTRLAATGAFHHRQFVGPGAYQID